MLPTPAEGAMPSPTTPYIVVNLLCGLAAAWLGGMVALRVAKGETDAVLGLAGLVFLMGVITALGNKGQQPSWYAWTLPVLGVVGVLVGGGVVP
jgi:hypothetical protein